MSYFLPHLPSGWHVDQAILSEDDRVVIIRFGHDWDPQCMKMDETLYGVSEKVQNFAVIYLVDITQVPDFNKMYELYDPCTVMFFYRNKHIMIDLGTGNNNKINWAMDNKQELIDIIETVYRGASKGRGLVVSPKGGLSSIGPQLLSHHLYQIIPRATDIKLYEPCWSDYVQLQIISFISKDLNILA
ncbi:U4/U6-U5 snRNP complex subunit dib1 [Tulasnella sp. 408]|nr:U4/U6-U5 snRNP complex subunit dib1 [Tulasnella sp. 408]